MSKEPGFPRHRPLRVRPLSEEDDAARYKREGWDPRKTYAENMGRESLFDRPDEELEWPAVEATPKRPNPSPEAQELAAEGRGQDTEIAHLARGEFVVPQALQTPELLAALRRAAAAYNIPMEMLSVGNAMNRINPQTGAPEFGVMFGSAPIPGETSRQRDNSQGFESNLPETQMALNAIERLGISPWKNQTKDTLNKILNNGLSPSQIDSVYGQVTRNIPWDDMEQFKSINPNERPIGLTPNQKAILENQLNQLQPDDFRQTVRGHLDSAIQNGTITYLPSD